MIFGKASNRYYLKHAPVLLLGILSLLTVDYIQLLIPELYRLVINGVNLGQVVVDGQTLPFTREVLFQHICLPMIWIVVLMVIGRFLWRVCFFGSADSEADELRERKYDHIRRLSKQAGLFTWDKPAYACLATRIPTGTPITAEALRITERGEGYLFSLGLRDFRIRFLHGAARLQVPEAQLPLVLAHREEIVRELKRNYSAVMLDLEVGP